MRPGRAPSNPGASPEIADHREHGCPPGDLRAGRPSGRRLDETTAPSKLATTAVSRPHGTPLPHQGHRTTTAAVDASRAGVLIRRPGIARRRLRGLRRRAARQPVRGTHPRRDAGDQAGGRGHPRRRPVELHGDEGYDNTRVRRHLRRRGITARIARLGRDSSARLGRHRWVVERTLGWLLSCKRLAPRYDRSATTINALARLAVTFICARRLPANRCNVI